MASAPESPRGRSRGNMLKNVLLLSGMWGMGLGAAFVQIPSAQDVLVNAGRSSISTVPLGLIMLLSSPCAVLVPALIGRHGEKRTFVAASVLGASGALLQMTGVLLHSPDAELALILVGASVQSFTYASSNNLRFAVACFSTPEFLPKATALVLAGGVLSSLLGPLLSNVTRHMIPGADYAGNFLQIAVMYAVFGILAALADFEPPPKKREAASDYDVLAETVSMVLTEEGRRPNEGVAATEMQDDGESTSERSLVDMLKGTDLALLTFFQCLSYNIMAMYMTQFPLQMMALGYDANSRTVAVTLHMMGMFAPGLFSGYVVGWIGTWPTTFAGFVVFLLGGLVLGGMLGIANDSLVMFMVGMTVVGVGWNFSFVGPSAEVSRIYRGPAERSKVVGFNDGVMLLTIGVFLLAGSSMYEAIGSWRSFNFALMGASCFSAVVAAWREVALRRKKSSRAIASEGFLDELISDDSL